MKKVLSVFMCLVTVLSVFPALPFIALAGEVDVADIGATSLHTKSEALAWLKDKADNNRVVGDGWCSALASGYIQYLTGSYMQLNGKDYAYNYPSGWTPTKYYLGYVPQAGDLVVYDYSDWAFVDGVQCGHVGVVYSANSSSFTSVEQNVNGRYTQYCYNRSYNLASLHVWGFVRPNFKDDTLSKPSAPKDVLTSTTNGNLNIKWSPVSGATSYVVYVYSKSNCSECAFKKEVTACSVSGIQLNPGRYWIYVHAINGAGTGPGSSCVDYLTAPKNLKVSRVDTSIKLSWDSVPNANCYDVIMTDPKGDQKWLHTDNAEKTITNCIPGNYKFEVQSLYRNNGSTNGQVVGAHSDVVSYYFGLSAPKNLKVNNNDGNMNISWDKVDGATCYDVIITTPVGKIDYWHCHSTYKTITSYEDGIYKIEVQGLYRENESQTGQVAGPHTDVIIYEYQKVNQPVIHTHEWNSDYTVDKNPTCTENGSKSIHCKTCNEVKDTESIPAKGHKFGVRTVEKEPTCVSKGYTYYYCEDCDYSYMDNYVDATGNHEFENGICKVCGYPDIDCLECLSGNDTKTIKINTGGEYKYFKFTPNKNGTLNFYSVGSYDTYGYLYDSEMNELTHNDNSSEDSNFNINYDVIGGQTYILACRMYSSDEIGSFNVVINFESEESALIGDVNQDGKVDITDATEIQKYLVQLVSFNDEQFKLADTNGDGKVNIIDVTQIQKYLAGIFPFLG